jgi:hypothetical protein
LKTRAKQARESKAWILVCMAKEKWTARECKRAYRKGKTNFSCTPGLLDYLLWRVNQPKPSLIFQGDSCRDQIRVSNQAKRGDETFPVILLSKFCLAKHPLLGTGR